MFNTDIYCIHMETHTHTLFTLSSQIVFLHFFCALSLCSLPLFFFPQSLSHSETFRGVKSQGLAQYQTVVPTSFLFFSCLSHFCFDFCFSSLLLKFTDCHALIILLSTVMTHSFSFTRFIMSFFFLSFINSLTVHFSIVSF